MKKYPCFLCYGEGEVPSDAFMKWHIGKSWEKGHNRKIKDLCPHCCGKKIAPYPSASEYIEYLLRIYEIDTMHLSYSALDHPSILSILSRPMYKKAAVAVIFNEIKRLHGHQKFLNPMSAHTLLLVKHFLPKNKVPKMPKELMGKIMEMLSFLNQWGKDNGYIKNG